jgi:hypothetical protein
MNLWGMSMNAREYMKDMNTRQKIDYIWYYYKIHIIAAIVIIIFCGMFVHDRINSKDYVFNFTVIGNSINFDMQSSMEKEATQLLVGRTDSKKQVLFDFMSESKNAKGEVELQPAMQQKLIVKMASGEINVIALDKKLFSPLAAQGALLKLGDAKGLEFDNTKGIKAKDISGSDEYIGIDISDNKKLKDMGFDTDNKVLCILVKNENIDMAVKFVNWILK